MERCAVCNGRTIKADGGFRCMSSSCAGSEVKVQEEGVFCRCGQLMSYQGEDLWGQPNYTCIYCKTVKRM